VTKDQMRELVKECGLDWHKGFMPLFDGDDTNRYAVLIEAAMSHEREQCALVCDGIRNDRWAAYKNRPPYEGNETTRYSQHTEGESDGADLCADKIRARGTT